MPIAEPVQHFFDGDGLSVTKIQIGGFIQKRFPLLSTCRRDGRKFDFRCTGRSRLF